MVTWWLPPLQPLIPHSETFKTMHGWEKRILSGGFIFLFLFFLSNRKFVNRSLSLLLPSYKYMHAHTHTHTHSSLQTLARIRWPNPEIKSKKEYVWHLSFCCETWAPPKKKKRVKERKLLLDRKPIGGPLRNGITKYSCCFEQCTIPLPPLTAHPLPNALREYTSSHTSMHPRNLVPGACNISHLCTSVAYLFIFFCDHFTVFIKYCS